MALYNDAATILSSKHDQGSLKSRIYGESTLKSSPPQIYALIAETAKRDVFLKEVIDDAQLLRDEPKLTPLLALLLCHDHFFAKAGIAAPSKHPLRQSIEKHKARLQSEFTRARLRRKCASVNALRVQLDREKIGSTKQHPRWARINSLLCEASSTVTASLSQATRKKCLDEVLETDPKAFSYCSDEHVPSVLAFSPSMDLTKSDVYKKGELILQDKASCFPAYLLLGDQKPEVIGDVLDGCAAPGNKTTHLAAIMHESGSNGKVLACERDGVRSKTLQLMVGKAGADKKVKVLAKQDFLALDPHDVRFRNVTHLLLDPSCSGSGIIGREDVPKLALPVDTRAHQMSTSNGSIASRPKKRKREENGLLVPVSETVTILAADEEEVPINVTEERLQKLSNLQTRIVEHAMKFPAATRITYSTCSIHEQENEIVVSRLLASEVARFQQWTVLPRARQVEGMRHWVHRGVKGTTNNNVEENKLSEEELDACIRCNPADAERTMGFFVCAFIRDIGIVASSNIEPSTSHAQPVEQVEESWEGFD